MRTAETNGAFEFDPKFDPITILFSGSTSQYPAAVVDKPLSIPSSHIQSYHTNQKEPILKRKNSLDDLELEIEGINLDENIDTSVSIFLLFSKIFTIFFFSFIIGRKH